MNKTTVKGFGLSTSERVQKAKGPMGIGMTTSIQKWEVKLNEMGFIHPPLHHFIKRLLSEAIQQERERVRKWARRNAQGSKMGSQHVWLTNLLTYLSDETK